MDYTSGPWEVAELLPDKFVIKREGTFEIRTDDYDVCTDVPDGGPIRKIADALLIAAAPDLLEACKVALEDLEPYYEIDIPGGYAVMETVDKLRAAIAKAEGKA